MPTPAASSCRSPACLMTCVRSPAFRGWKRFWPAAPEITGLCPPPGGVRRPRAFLYDGRPLNDGHRSRLSMQAVEVKNLLEAQLADVQVEVEGEGCNFQLYLVGDALAAMSPVKRQQQVYAHLNPWIADGRIHAVTMKFFSRAEWAARRSE